MTEILEKGLLIGFGLTVTIMLFSFFNPIFALFNNQNQLQNFENFTLLIESGIEQSQQDENREIAAHYTLMIEIKIDIFENENNTSLFLYSDIKNCTIYSNCLIFINVNSLRASFGIRFSFQSQNNTAIIQFEMEDDFN